MLPLHRRSRPRRQPTRANKKPPSIALTWPLLLASVTAAIWVFVALAYVAHTGWDVSAVVAIISVLLPLLAPQFPRVELPRHFLAVALALEMLASCVWGGFRYWADHRAINVTGQVQMTGNTNMKVNMVAQADIVTTQTRPDLVITFSVKSDTAGSECAVETELYVTLVIGGSDHSSQSTDPGVGLDISLGANLQHIRLDVQATNPDNDPNCLVTVGVQEAELR